MKKYALVTGASSGIGWHLSLELAGRGYSILAISNQPEGLELLKAEVEKLPAVSCHTTNLNLATAGAADEVVALCNQHNMVPEILVNNAGILVVGEFISREPIKIRDILNLYHF